LSDRRALVLQLPKNDCEKRKKTQDATTRIKLANMKSRPEKTKRTELEAANVATLENALDSSQEEIQIPAENGTAKRQSSEYITDPRFSCTTSTESHNAMDEQSQFDQGGTDSTD
jgi:hypothetical protein